MGPKRAQLGARGTVACVVHLYPTEVYHATNETCWTEVAHHQWSSLSEDNGALSDWRKQDRNADTYESHGNGFYLGSSGNKQWNCSNAKQRLRFVPSPSPASSSDLEIPVKNQSEKLWRQLSRNLVTPHGSRHSIMTQKKKAVERSNLKKRNWWNAHTMEHLTSVHWNALNILCQW